MPVRSHHDVAGPTPVFPGAGEPQKAPAPPLWPPDGHHPAEVTSLRTRLGCRSTPPTPPSTGAPLDSTPADGLTTVTDSAVVHPRREAFVYDAPGGVAIARLSLISLVAPGCR
jgi:hypothetical protein